MSINTPAYRRKYYHENKDTENAKRLRRNEHLKKRFGITIDDYEAMLKAQGGVCAVCGGPPSGKYKRLHVDHDHLTDEIRALLCHHCNIALGLAEDDPRLLRLMADYLESFPGALS
jgi:hypothetical protein